MRTRDPRYSNPLEPPLDWELSQYWPYVYVRGHRRQRTFAGEYPVQEERPGVFRHSERYPVTLGKPCWMLHQAGTAMGIVENLSPLVIRRRPEVEFGPVLAA